MFIHVLIGIKKPSGQLVIADSLGEPLPNKEIELLIKNGKRLTVTSFLGNASGLLKYNSIES